MKRNKKRIVAAIAVIGALAAGGAAFTASNTISSDSVAGYGNVTVSGANVSNIANTLSADGKTITGVQLTFASDIDPASTVEIGWSQTGDPTSLSSTGCTVAADGSTATCTGLSQTTTTANEFAVAVYR
jgi:hypothetical protein